MNTASEVWLLDCSGSMIGDRIEQLTQLATDAIKTLASPVRLICFNTELIEIESPGQIPRPSGGTWLHLALDRAATLMAARTVVFTDGEPSDEVACFKAADRIPGIVTTVFCGDARDRKAIAFCDKLARLNGGETITRDVQAGQSLLCPEVKSLLGLPVPVAL